MITSSVLIYTADTENELRNILILTKRHRQLTIKLIYWLVNI